MASGRLLGREEALFWVWEGGDSMSVTQSWTLVGSGATEALDDLVERIRKETQSYREKAVLLEDRGRLWRADDMLDWQSGPGAAIIAEIRSKILAASPEQRDLMRVSLESGVRLADIERSRDMRLPDNWDMVMQWAEDILPMVRRAFRDYPARGTGSETEAPWLTCNGCAGLAEPQIVGRLAYEDEMSDWARGSTGSAPW